MVAVNRHKTVGPSGLNILGLEEDASPDTAADYLAIYDASASKNKKVLLDNLGLGGGGVNCFTTFQTPYGTAPVADSSTDTMTFVSNDGTVYISGDSSTDTINFQMSPVNLIVTSSSAANHPLIARGVLAQSVNTFEVQKSTSAIFFYANETDIKADVIFGLGHYATGSLPTASSWEGYMAYDSTTNEVKFSDGSTWAAFGGGGGGSGDVVGPASSTNNAITRFDGTTGKLLQDYTSSPPVISDTGQISSPDASHSLSERFGHGTSITGANATAMGANSVASLNSVAFGAYASASGTYGSAFGLNAAANASGAVAFGYNVVVNQTNATGIGNGATCTGGYSVAIGFNSSCSATNSVAIGASANAGTNEVMIGGNAAAGGSGSVCIGINAASTSSNGVAIGTSSSCGAGGVAVGNNAVANTTGGIAIGNLATCNGKTDSLIFGQSATVYTAESANFGSAATRYKNFFLGSGEKENNASLPDVTIQNTRPITGTDYDGPALILKGSGSTGAGLGGSVKIQTVAAGVSGTGERTTGNDMLEANSAGEIILNAEDAATADASLWANSLSFYLDETGNTVTVKAKYADGTTVKTGTIALT